MSEQDQIYGIYIKVNGDGYITAIDSDAYITDFSGWIKVDEGRGYLAKEIKKHNGLRNGLQNEYGLWNYKCINGRPVYKPQTIVTRDHNSLSTLEKDFVATRNYNIGVLIVIENRLFEVISTIPKGSKIIIDENVVETTIEHFINSRINGEREEKQ